MKRGSAVPLILIVVALVGLIFVLSYNSLISKENAVRRAWADVETQYQRRLDLIPNLVETVKSYATYERETLNQITEARTKVEAVLRSEKVDPVALSQVGKTLDKALYSLLALVENYPDLKASENFLALQDQLEGTENRIAVARQRYNWAVEAYNRALRTFPTILIARVLGFEERPFFKSEEGAEEAVKVKIDLS